MLRGLAFYGTGAAVGAALTFFDPQLGAVVTEIPTAGKKERVVIRGVSAFCDAVELASKVKITIGSDGDYHDIEIRPRGDADNVNAMLESDVIEPLGDFIVRENSQISGLAYDADGDAEFCGVLWYDDLEPEQDIPTGRIISIAIGGGADAATAFATTGGETDICKTYKFETSSTYYVCGGTFYGEDKVPQVIAIESPRNAAVFTLGRQVFSSCPLVFKGNDTIVEKLQVKAATKVNGILRCVEVPADSNSTSNTEVEKKTTISNVLIQKMGVARNAVSGFFRR